MSSSIPQSSVLGPLKFIAYTEDLPAVIEKRSVDPCLYSDDSQVNVHLRIKDVTAALQNMETCVFAMLEIGARQSAYNLTRQRLTLFGFDTSNGLKNS